MLRKMYKEDVILIFINLVLARGVFFIREKVLFLFVLDDWHGFYTLFVLKMYAEYMSGWSELTILMLLLYDTDVDVRCKVLKEHNFVIKKDETK